MSPWSKHLYIGETQNPRQRNEQRIRTAMKLQKIFSLGKNAGKHFISTLNKKGTFNLYKTFATKGWYSWIFIPLKYLGNLHKNIGKQIRKRWEATLNKRNSKYKKPRNKIRPPIRIRMKKAGHKTNSPTEHWRNKSSTSYEIFKIEQKNNNRTIFTSALDIVL